MDYEHTLTAADVKIRAQHAASIPTALSAGWPETPFITDGCWSECNEDPGGIATLATGRKVYSADEVTIGDVAHYLTDVVGLLGGDQVRLGADGEEEALVLFTDAAVAQRIKDAHANTSHTGPVIELVVTRRHPADADVAFTAFDLWLRGPSMDGDWPYGEGPEYDPSDADCEPGCSYCTDDSVPDFVNGRWYWDGNGPAVDDEDPYDYPCQDCGAEPGQDCHPYCTATPAANQLEPLTVTVIDVPGPADPTTIPRHGRP